MSLSMEWNEFEHKICHWNGIGFEHEILSLGWNGD